MDEKRLLFKRTWKRLAKKGHCDGYGGAECRRVYGQWVEAGMPEGKQLEYFIAKWANWCPGGDRSYLLCVYGPGSQLNNCDNSTFAKANEYGVAWSARVQDDGSLVYPYIIRFTRGSSGRNKAAAERYLSLRQEGKCHMEARDITLSEFPHAKE
jgi:hypothetical protein